MSEHQRRSIAFYIQSYSIFFSIQEHSEMVLLYLSRIKKTLVNVRQGCDYSSQIVNANYCNRKHKGTIIKQHEKRLNG